MGQGASSGRDNAAKARLSGGCPVMHKGRQQEALDPNNQMPATPNQAPAPGQARPLPTDRVTSNIPQADGASRWVYPSPQMFYNALRRKGKADDGEEEHMEAVVAIHNNMNERTWKRILEWEQRYCDQCKDPTLARFVGRPDELSLEAWLRYLRTGERPFDRHDWFVNRCGREVRYIIDYYDVAERRALDTMPSLEDESSVRSIDLHVRYVLATAVLRRHSPAPCVTWSPRPAMDSVDALRDRAEQAWQELASRAAPRLPTGKDPSEDGGTQQRRVVMEQLHAGCVEQIAAVNTCEGDAACADAHANLVVCLASQVDACRAKADAFRASAANETPDAGAKFTDVQDCLTQFARTL